MTGMEWRDDCPQAGTLSRGGFLVSLGLGKGWAMPARLLEEEWPVAPFPHVRGPKGGPKRPQPQEPHQSGSRRSPVRKLC